MRAGDGESPTPALHCCLIRSRWPLGQDCQLPLQTQSGSPDIQIACPLPDIGSLGPTVRYVAASPTKGAPAPDQEQSIAGRRLSGSTRPKAAGDVSGKLPFNA